MDCWLPTGLGQKFAVNNYGEADVAMFDFTSMYAAENACRAKKIISVPVPKECDCDNQASRSSYSHPPNEKRSRLSSSISINEHNNDEAIKCDKVVQKRKTVQAASSSSLLLMGLVGDSLLEPFWPTGSGCGRGFLSAMDSAWMCREWAIRKCSINNHEAALSVLMERESIYRLLNQTKADNLVQNYASYSLNPTSRYPNLSSSSILLHQCKHLLYDDVPPPIPYAESTAAIAKQTLAAKRLRRATIASTSFDSIVTDKVIQEESIMSSESRDVILNRFVPGNPADNRSSFRLQEEDFDEQLAAFEENFHQGLMNSNSASAIACRGEKQITSGNMQQNLSELMMSPSASNLASIGKHRAKDIEIAMRQRRQQQSEFKRGSYDTSSGSSRSSQRRQHQELMQLEQQQMTQNKSRVAWFLEQQQLQATNQDSSCSIASSSTSQPHPINFANRIKDLEAKLYAASGCIDPSSLSLSSSSGFPEQPDQQKKIINSKGSTHVMKTASTLEKILNPEFQDKKLKEKAKDYRKKNSDIKIVSKMTTETDWNKKCWEERERKLEGKDYRPQYYPFRDSVRSFLPPNHFLRQSRNRSQSFFYYCPSRIDLISCLNNNSERETDDDDSHSNCDPTRQTFYNNDDELCDDETDFNENTRKLAQEEVTNLHNHEQQEAETVCDRICSILSEAICFLSFILFAFMFTLCSFSLGLSS